MTALYVETIRFWQRPKGTTMARTLALSGVLLCAAELIAQAQFRAGQYEAALLNFRRVDVETLSRDDRIFLQYLTACCQRNLGRLDEAAANYREVVNSRDDEALADSARWQLEAIAERRK